MVQDKETFKVKVLEANQGGLVTRLLSLQAFIPISQLAKEKDAWLSEKVWFRCNAQGHINHGLEHQRSMTVMKLIRLIVMLYHQ